MSFKRIALAASALSLVATTVCAAEEGWYVSVAGGGNHIHDDSLTGTGFNQEVEYDFGYAAQGAVGYQYSNGLRTELEGGYRSNDVDTIASGRGNGDANVVSAMVNVFYDFDISDTGLDTYVGAGAGVAYVDFDGVQPVGGSVIDDSDTTPAFQGMAGVSYEVGEATELYANYNYFVAANTDFKNAATVKTDTDYDSSTIMLGLKFNMFDKPEPVVEKPKPMATATPVVHAAPPPPPPPAPAPQPISRTYIVFFDLDKDNVSNEAMKILSQAAQDAKHGNAVNIQVIGHADTSGTEKHNMDLSNRRASNVESALANMGIQLDMIQTAAKGESDPLVPTADGVREPQNRRAEIMYVITPQQ